MWYIHIMERFSDLKRRKSCHMRQNWMNSEDLILHEICQSIGQTLGISGQGGKVGKCCNCSSHNHIKIKIKLQNNQHQEWPKF